MNKKTVISNLIGLALVVAGVCICIYAGSKIDFHTPDFSAEKLEEKITVIAEPFHNIEIHDVMSNVEVLLSEDGQTKAVCTDGKRIYHDVSVKDDTLLIQYRDERHWYEKIGINLYHLNIKLYLPKQEYEKITANTVSGNICTGTGLSFYDVDMESISGRVNIESEINGKAVIVTVSGGVTLSASSATDINVETVSGGICVKSGDKIRQIDLETVSGSIELEEIQCRNLDAETVSGDCLFRNVIVSDELEAESTSGNIRLDGCDGQSLSFETTSGDVVGTLGTGKEFEISPSSGTVHIPDSEKNGVCEVVTTSGDVDFQIVKS